MTEKEPSSREDTLDLPRARPAGRWLTPVWLVPLFAAGFVGWLFYESASRWGETIEIRFENGGNITADDTPVRYRGVEVGKVRSIDLAEDLQAVLVRVELTSSASAIARQGAEFWIVEPEVSLTGVQGLRTLVSGEYIAARPGTGEPKREFIGRAGPPPGGEAGLPVVLLAREAGSLKQGSPITYRGIEVGRIVSLRLGDDAQTVEAHGRIRRGYAPLVRKGSRFWNTGDVSIEFDILAGNVTAPSPKTILTGGVAFATPDEPGETAPAGTAFRLHPEPDPGWQEWRPAISVTAGEGDQ